jgi:signal transduction histidine kinase
MRRRFGSPSYARQVSEVRSAGRDSTRARVADVLLITLIAGMGFATAVALGTPAMWPAWFGPVEQILGVVCCVLLWWRRTHPIAVATVLVVGGALLASVSIAPLVALYTVALTCSTRVTTIFVALNLISVVGPLLLRPETPASLPFLLASHIVGVVAAAALGLVIRSRRQLVDSLRERARAAEVEAALRATQAEHEAREELAREMHDVLGHRLSLLSVQAGALSYNRDTAAADVARAAEEIRRNAHSALQDLREVLDVLRSPQAAASTPGISDLPALLAEVAMSETPPRLVDDTGLTTGDTEVTAIIACTLYRFVQEGLTNVRKHAPGAETTIRIRGSRGHGIDAAVENGPATRAPLDSGPSSGGGIRGLAERATLVGGHIEHGPSSDGGWLLTIRLPWPS